MFKKRFRLLSLFLSLNKRRIQNCCRTMGVLLLCSCAAFVLLQNSSELYVLNVDVLTPPHLVCHNYHPFEPEVYTDLNFISDGHPKIERIIHQTWKSQQIPSHFVNNVKSFVQNNPSWKYYLWTDESARQLLVDHYPWLLPLWDGVWYSTFTIRRADALRYVVLYHYGGIYADLDMVNFRSLEPAIMKHSCIFTPEPYEHAVVRAFRPYLLSNAVMLCASKHPFLERLIENLATTEFYHNSVDSTGPGYVTTQFSIHNNLPNADESVHIFNGRSMDPSVDNSPYMNTGLYPLSSNRSVYIANTRYFIFSLDKTIFRRIIRECSSWKSLDFLHKRSCVNAKTLGLRRERHRFAFTEHQWYMTWINWKNSGYLHHIFIDWYSVDILTIVPGCFIYEKKSRS